ncbi:MAG: DUF2828 family protein [Clostridiales bacterium]|nr:DUF2828 family protein [Candidatus Cacconaster stercorequi]
MLELLKKEANMTRTENGAATYETTMSDCLDLFATIGAIRRQSDEEIISRFVRAYTEDADTAMKILFFGRDVRGGLGERCVFRVIIRWLADNEPASLRKNIRYIAEYGRYDDLLSLLDTACEKDALLCIKQQLAKDMLALAEGGEVSLLAKWMPSINASNADTVRAAKRVARALGMTDATYRKTLVKLRERIRILENNLRERDYSFDYAKQPSKAMFKYRSAFMRNDRERYCAFMERVEQGSATLHTGTLMPYEVIAPCFRGFGMANVSEDARRSMDVTWNALENFAGDENALVVVDGSGSMYGGSKPIPETVAMSLGIYFAERNRGVFHNHFITFSTRPQLVEIKGADIVEKVRYCAQFNECSNTNIQRVFELILNTAVKHRVPQSEMPSTIYIVSDMEFDNCADGAQVKNFDYAKRLFAKYGYVLPKLVFWNVDSRNRQQPVRKNEQGVALISGCTPRLFSMVVGGENVTPYSMMMDTIGAERYAPISA